MIMLHYSILSHCLIIYIVIRDVLQHMYVYTCKCKDTYIRMTFTYIHVHTQVVCGGCVCTYSEDGGEGHLRGRREGEHGKVSDEPRGDRVPASPRRGARCTDGHILREGEIEGKERGELHE